ncbi:MAG: DUF1996 domain-containing protein [Burkholderiaceae bacterium]
MNHSVIRNQPPRSRRATAAAWAVTAMTLASCGAAPSSPSGPDTLPFVDASKLPAPDPGKSGRLISKTGEQPYRDPDGMGAFRTVCKFTHMNFDDPLVYPGQPGKSHLHAFFGNAGVDANSTPESIRDSGNSTCRGGTVNRTGYWVPAIIDTKDGRPITPTGEHDFYYKTGYHLFGQDAKVRPFPVGFRMIAGDSKSREPQRNVGHFECTGRKSETLPDCPNGELRQIVEFPQCWDGVNLDSPDHRSHVVYARGEQCPKTHPVHFPQITFIIKYQVPASGSAGWRLSSDIAGTPAGSSNHGDWVNGWEQDVMETFVERVVSKGLSAGSHIVGDGRVIYY